MLSSYIIGLLIVAFSLFISGESPETYGHLELTVYYAVIVIFLEKVGESSREKQS